MTGYNGIYIFHPAEHIQTMESTERSQRFDKGMKECFFVLIIQDTQDSGRIAIPDSC